MITINTRQSDNVSIVEPSGRIGPLEMGQIKQTLKKLLARGRKRVVVNLTCVPELSWGAIGALLEKSNEFRSQKGEFKIVGLNETLWSTFRSVGAHRVMDLYDSEGEALKSFKAAR